MKPLTLLVCRILLALCVSGVIVSWVACQWNCFGLLADAARVQFYVHADAGGWFFDLRRPDVVSPERGIRTYFEAMERADRLPDGTISRQRRQPVLDQFDRTGRWSVAVPGLRLLSEDSSQLFRGGRRWGIGMRHWLLLFFTAAMALWVGRRLRRAERSMSVTV